MPAAPKSSGDITSPSVTLPSALTALTFGPLPGTREMAEWRENCDFCGSFIDADAPTPAISWLICSCPSDCSCAARATGSASRSDWPATAPKTWPSALTSVSLSGGTPGPPAAIASGSPRACSRTFPERPSELTRCFAWSASMPALASVPKTSPKTSSEPLARSLMSPAIPAIEVVAPAAKPMIEAIGSLPPPPPSLPPTSCVTDAMMPVAPPCTPPCSCWVAPRTPLSACCTAGDWPPNEAARPLSASIEPPGSLKSFETMSMPLLAASAPPEIMSHTPLAASLAKSRPPSTSSTSFAPRSVDMRSPTGALIPSICA